MARTRILDRLRLIPLLGLWFFGCSIPSLSRSPLETISTFRFFQTNTTTYSLSFNLSGLEGKGLVVRNGSDSVLPTQNGSFLFPTRVITGTAYSISIETQPTEPSQTCRLRGESGTVARGDVSTIEVICDPASLKDSVSGTVTGLEGSGLVLSNVTSTGTETVTVNSSSFSFSPQDIGSSFSVSITSQPTSPSQTCVLGSTTSGTLASGGSKLSISCTTNSYPIRVQVVGIQGTLAPGDQLNLMLNGSATLSFQQDGTQSYTESIKSGATYTVVTTNSPGGTTAIVPTGKCTIPSNSGTVGSAAVTVLVNCSNGFTVQGTVTSPGGSTSSIIGSGLVVQLSPDGGSTFSAQTVNLAPGATQIIFPDPIPAGLDYQINILAFPSSPSQECTTNNSGGTITTDVTNVVIDCSLPSGSDVTATVNNDTTITFPNAVSGFSEFRYTTGNGSQASPTCSTGTVGSSVSVDSNLTSTIKVIQCPVSSTWVASVVWTYTYTLQVATPTISPTSGSLLDNGTQVSLSSSTTGPTFFCHSAGTTTPVDPVCGSTYNSCTTGTLGNYTFPGVSDRIVKGVMCKANYSSSSVVSATYSPTEYSIGGTISGLTTPFGSNTFVLQLNGGNDLTIAANGSYTFGSQLKSGQSYTVSVLSQPTNPWQTCTISSGSGTITNSNITSAAISCTLNQYTMSGTVTSGTSLPSGLTVTNGISSVSVIAGGTSTPISFADPINSGTTVNLQITAEPAGWVCSLATEFQVTIAGSNVTNANVSCLQGYRLGNGISSRKVSAMSYHYYRASLEDFAGTGSAGFANGSAGTSTFTDPMDIAYDGSSYYVADSQNHAIRRISSSNLVTTIAGSGTPGNAVGTTGDRFNRPRGLATNGIYLFVSEELGNRIKRVRLSDQYTETIAGDNSTLSPTGATVNDTNPLNARFNTPSGLALDGEILYIAERGSNSIRKMNLRSGEVTTLVTGGNISSPEGITHHGDFLYVANSGSHIISKINKSTGVETLLAGSFGGFRDGIANNGLFNSPFGIATDGTFVYVSDRNNHRLRKIDISSQKVLTLMGWDSGTLTGTGVDARLANPGFLNFTGTQLVMSVGNHIRAITTGASTQVRSHFPLNGVYTNLNPLGSPATVNGSPSFATGRYGESEGAVKFATGEGLVSTPLTGSTSSTIAAWVFWDGSDTPANQVIFHNGVTNTNGSGLFIDDATQRLFVLQGGSSSFDTGIRLPHGLWVHLALIKNSNQYTVYVNGKPVFRTIFSETSPTTEFRIGNGAFLTEFFSGRIADVRIVNRAWDLGELHHVSKQANSGLVGLGYSTHPDELVMHYEFSNNFIPTGALGGVGSGTGLTSTKDAARVSSSAYRFDGSTSSFQASANGLPNSNSTRTICAQVFPSRYPASGNTFPIFQYGNTTVAGQGFSLRMGNTAGVQQLMLGGIGSADASVAFALPLHRWSTVCGVFNFSTVQVFVNGVSLMSPTSVTGMNTIIGSGMRVGYDGLTSYFQGKIDEVTVYAKALSAFEVRLVSSQNPIGLVAFYDFNGDNNDLSGFANNADNGSISYVANRDGQSNGALSFDGSQVVSVSSMEILPRGSQPRTICAWAKVSEYSSLRTIVSYGIVSASNLTHLLIESSYVNFAGYASDSIGFHYNILNRWTHICGAYESGTVRTYIHGELHGSSAGSWNTPLGNFRIGQRVDGLLPFIGAIDDLMIWNRALGDEEIKALSGNHPTHISGWNSTVASSILKLHYTAESLSNLSNGASVTSWPDHSGNDFVLNDTSAAPTFVTNGNNGRPGVQFSQASSQFIRTTATATGIGVTDATTFLVFKRNSLTDGVILESESNNGLGITLKANRLLYGAWVPGSGITPGGTGRIIQSLDIYTSTADSWITQIRHNHGVSASILRLGLDISEAGTNLSTTKSGGIIGLGRGNSNGGSLTYFDGNISEIIRMNSNLSGADIAIISCYLSSRYGLIGTTDLITCD